MAVIWYSLKACVNIMQKAINRKNFRALKDMKLQILIAAT
jgi:hypothetical protein